VRANGMEMISEQSNLMKISTQQLSMHKISLKKPAQIYMMTNQMHLQVQVIMKKSDLCLLKAQHMMIPLLAG
jgi:hypothetical protein